MDSSIVISILAAVGTAIGSVLTYLGIRFTQRSAARAAEATQRLETTKVSAEAYEAAKETWKEHVDSLKERVSELVVRVQQLEDQRNRDSERIADLKVEQERDRSLIRQLQLENQQVISFARVLLRILGEHNIPYPSPPAFLDAGSSPNEADAV
jgi:uncharacterized membrane-anchored protein YhcB (DUF1043 family)